MSPDEIYQLLSNRQPATAFDPDWPGVPWGEDGFSKYYFEHGTRDEAQTELEATRLIDWMELSAGSCVLDIGCGGGRTLSALEEAGISGKGIDIGPFPVEVARAEGLDVVEGDFREQLPEGPFDAAIMLYGQFTCLTSTEAAELVRRVHEKMKPGGLFFVETTLGPAFIDAIEDQENWTATETSIFGPRPCLLLDEHLIDEAVPAYVRRSYGVPLQGGQLQRVQQTSIIYDPNSLAQLFKPAGWRPFQLLGDWDESPFDEDAPNLLAIFQAQ